MSGLHKIAALGAASMGLSFGYDFGSWQVAPHLRNRPNLPPAAPEPLTKRQKRRLRGKAKALPTPHKDENHAG